MTVQEFCKKIIPFLKKRGIKGVYRKLLEKAHVIPTKNHFLEDYEFLVDDVKIPFDEKEYEIHKDDNIGSVTITADYIEKKGTPLIMMRGQERLPMNNAEA